MKNLKLLKKAPIFLTVAILFVFIFFFSQKTFYLVEIPIQNARLYTYSKLSFFGTFVEKFKTIQSLIQENLKLKEENLSLLSKLALNEELKKQNDFLRETLGMGPILKYKPTEARTYNLEFTPKGHFLLINKGAEENMKKDDIIISSSGVLIGQITSVYDNFSRVSLISDPNTKVTIKLLNRNTYGISRGMLGDNLAVDFISQNDEIAENDIVVTSGNDLFPSGLIVGRVSKINFEGGGLFKKVEIRAEFNTIDISRVLIINR